MYYKNEFKCFEEFAVVIDEYIDRYNNQRIQEKQNGYLL
ncbi:MAG: IS3 family transposase [Thomasclavelia ramosa]